jgi:hypothetical protein
MEPRRVPSPIDAVIAQPGDTTWAFHPSASGSIALFSLESATLGPVSHTGVVSIKADDFDLFTSPTYDGIALRAMRYQNFQDLNVSVIVTPVSSIRIVLRNAGPLPEVVSGVLYLDPSYVGALSPVAASVAGRGHRFAAARRLLG